MINCIDCENLMYYDKKEKEYKHCDYANDSVKECIYFKNAHRKMVHLDMNYAELVKEMLE